MKFLPHPSAAPPVRRVFRGFRAPRTARSRAAVKGVASVASRRCVPSARARAVALDRAHAPHEVFGINGLTFARGTSREHCTRRGMRARRGVRERAHAARGPGCSTLASSAPRVFLEAREFSPDIPSSRKFGALRSRRTERAEGSAHRTLPPLSCGGPISSAALWTTALEQVVQCRRGARLEVLRESAALRSALADLDQDVLQAPRALLRVEPDETEVGAVVEDDGQE